MTVAKDVFNIVPSDTVNSPQRIRAIYVGGTGNIVVVNEDLTTALFTAVPVGTILEVDVIRVNNTNTTATLLVGMARGGRGIEK